MLRNMGDRARISTEWTAYSREKQDFKLVRATNQREAIKKAVNKYDIIPENTHDVRPRTGTQQIMTTQEFNKFMEAGLV